MKNETIINALKSALSTHKYAWIEEVSATEAGTITIEISGIEEGEEYAALDSAVDALRALGLTISDSSAGDQIGRFWIVANA